MKALTLKHPWPWAICCLGKRIENRTWRPPRSLIGHRLAIHGGKQPSSVPHLRETAWVAHDLMQRFGLPEGVKDVTLQDVILTGVVAVCTLADVVTDSTDPWFDGPVGWVLSDLHVLDKPFPCSGKQGLWDVPNEFRVEQ